MISQWCSMRVTIHTHTCTHIHPHVLYIADLWQFMFVLCWIIRHCRKTYSGSLTPVSSWCLLGQFAMSKSLKHTKQHVLSAFGGSKRILCAGPNLASSFDFKWFRSSYRCCILSQMSKPREFEELNIKRSLLSPNGLCDLSSSPPHWWSLKQLYVVPQKYLD